MTPKQIEDLFFQTIEEKAIYKKLEGISEDKIYNWRKGRGKKPSAGEMLEVLYQLKKISILPSLKPVSLKIGEENVILDCSEFKSPSPEEISKYKHTFTFNGKTKE